MVFFICLGCGVLFIILGLWDMRSKKPVGIYNNVKAPSADEISDVRGYNRACGKLIMAYGLLIILDGLSIINASEITIGIVLMMTLFPGAIGMIIIFEVVIAPKYIKKNNKKRGQ